MLQAGTDLLVDDILYPEYLADRRQFGELIFRMAPLPAGFPVQVVQNLLNLVETMPAGAACFCVFGNLSGGFQMIDPGDVPDLDARNDAG